jgi:predicted NAD-dependent protein-ADP-ribosyltransferase YbiA (DUF1768 family)
MITNFIISNPNDIPFGVLHPSYKDPITINNIRWNTTINYVYGNILIDDVYKRMGSMLNPRDINTEMMNLFKENENYTMQTAITSSLKEMIDADSRIEQLLLSTGKSGIVYKNANKFLGDGDDGTGDNYYGKYLMNIRDEIFGKMTKNKQSMFTDNYNINLYNTYVNSQIVLAELQNGSTLSEYVNMPVGDVVKKITSKVGYVKQKYPSMETIIALRKIGKIPTEILVTMNNPTYIVNFYRHQHIRNVLKNNLTKVKTIIFDNYLDYILEKYYTDVNNAEYAKAKDQELSKFTDRKKLELYIDKLYNLYITKNISERFYDSVLDKVKDIIVDIPEDEQRKIDSFVVITDVNDIGVFNNPSDFDFNKKTSNIQTQYTQPNTPKIIYIYPPNTIESKYNMLSPYTLSKDFIVMKHKFNSIASVIFTFMMAKLPIVKSFDEAYKTLGLLILNNDFTGMYAKYIEIKNLYIQNQMLVNMFTIMDKKIQSRELYAQTLVQTGTSKISFNVKNKNEQQFYNDLASYYMKKRVELIQRYDNDIVIEESSFINIFDDLLIKRWVEMRLGDICFVITQLMEYTNYDNSELLESDLLEMVDKLYHPCYNITKLSNKIDIDPPGFVSEKIRKSFGSYKVSKQMINMIWKRIAIIIYYFSIDEKLSKNKLKKILTDVEYVNTKNVSCNNIINDNESNCIILALLNLIEQLIKFNPKYDGNSKQRIQEKDVVTATSIILNQFESTLTESDNVGNDNFDMDNIFMRNAIIDQDLLNNENTKKKINVDVRKGMVDLNNNHTNTANIDNINDDEFDKALDELFEDDDDRSNDNYGDSEHDEDENTGDNDNDDEGNSPIVIPNVEIPVSLKSYITNYNIENVDETCVYILTAVHKIKSSKLTKSIKHGRINFFLKISDIS